MSTADKKIGKKLTASIVAVVILALCLCVSTYALVLASVKVEGNFFKTGTVQINLNDGKPIIEQHEFIFEPGMTVKKDFFIENQSTWEVYYKLYFENVTGGLSDVLEVTVKEGDEVLLRGTAGELTRANVEAADDALSVNERRVLSIYFHFPEEAGNSAQNLNLSFNLCAEAVQTKNNPNKLFD